MKVLTDCEKCPFKTICRMRYIIKRLPFDEDGLGLCPKLPEMKLLRCRNCLFCHKSKSIGGSGKYAMKNGHPIYTCAAMREKGYLVKQGSSCNMPTQKAMEMGLFKIKEGTYINGDGVNVVTKTVKVTGKGQQYFINKFLKGMKEA